MKEMTQGKLQHFVTLAMLVALHVVLERFLSISAWNMRIGFSFVALVLAGIFYGPAGAATTGAIGDIIGMLLFPSGPYFPGFTVNAALSGAVFGLFLHRKQSAPRIAGAVCVNQLILSLFVQTLWISILYGAPYRTLLPVRLTQCLVMIPVQFIVIRIFSGQILLTLRRALPQKAAGR